MPKVLEVIVTSAAEALEAEAGGADRLELVYALQSGGLTPSQEVAHEVISAVRIPVRVMVRGNASMAVSDHTELDAMQVAASSFADLRIDGLVMGWVKAGQVDVEALEAVLATSNARVTFHRAFEHVADPFEAIRTLKRYSQIDRILTSGGPGSWAERKYRLLAWSRAAAPEIIVLAGGDLTHANAAELLNDPDFPEVHVGRAVRNPQEVDGKVDRAQIASLKNERIAG